MQRRGGKRIRMDEPPPPEYESPMTPVTPLDGSGTELQEPYTPYTPYNNQPATPLHTGGESKKSIRGLLDPEDGGSNSSETSMQSLYYRSDLYGGPEYSEAAAGQAYQQQQLYEQQQQQQQQTLAGYDQTGQYDQPPTPVNMVTRVRVTRARVRAAAVAAAPPPPPAPSGTPAPLTTTIVTTRRGGLAIEEPKKRRPGRRPISELMAEDENSLYYIIRQGKVSLQAVVDDWIDSYKVNRDAAVLSLMQFFISASGCKGKMTSSMQASKEHATIIQRMTEEFLKGSGEYPLIMTGQTGKKFRNNFCDFVQVLVKQCQYVIIYDQYLMDNLISLLTGLSDSQVRAFRHTATLAALKLMTALVDIALTVGVILDNTQRQYEAERQKACYKRASDKLESLMSKRQELEENMDEIKNMLKYMFKHVFLRRYRDTWPEIRAICMAEVGVWMKKSHEDFLDDSYLKYIGWNLYDKVGEVRLRCLQALQPLYASEELKGKLELFTSKFKDRIISMTLDKDCDAAVQAVHLVISILKHHRDILTDKDCEHMYELVYSSHRAVAQAAGEFLNERMFVPNEESVAGIRTKRGKQRLPNTPLIRNLVQFFIESELHEHGAYLVDSLIESNEVMKDWECMTDLLLEEPGPLEEALNDRQETSLIKIMVCCIRQAATGKPPDGRGPTRKTLSAKKIKQVQDDKLRLTEHFIQTLPAMLDKYRADTEKLANLLSVPRYFELNVYKTSHQETNLDLLLKKMASIVEEHHDTGVLETCAKTMELLCTDSSAVLTRCDVARSILIDMIVSSYKEAVDDWKSLIEEKETPDEDKTFSVVYSLKKVATFYNCHNLGNWGIWDSIFKYISDAKDGNKTLPEEAVRYCISACFFALLWDLHRLEEVMANGANGSEQLQQLKTRLNMFMDTMKKLLMSGQNQTCVEEAYLTICDLLVVFCDQLGNNPQLAELVYEPDRGLQIQLNDFIQNYVFIMEEDDEQDEHSKIEELHKRRNFLASFCKLIVYNMMPTKVAADVFKHYVKYYNDYGDIIKATLGKAREINKTNCARTMAISLTMLFRELQRDGTRINRQSEDFVSLKALAKKFALSFGLNAVKNREAITALHREGILFSVNPLANRKDPTRPPPNLPFLEILTEFTSKLLKEDKRLVQTFLDQRAAGMSSRLGEGWQELHKYRNSLVRGATDQPPVASEGAYSCEKKEYAAEEEEQGEEAEEATSDQEFNTGRKRRRQSKLFSSSKKQERARPRRWSKIHFRVVTLSRHESRGRTRSEDSMPSSSEPLIQEDTSLSQLSARFHSVLSSICGSQNEQKHGFFTSTQVSGSSDYPSTISSFWND